MKTTSFEDRPQFEWTHSSKTKNNSAKLQFFQILQSSFWIIKTKCVLYRSHKEVFFPHSFV